MEPAHDITQKMEGQTINPAQAVPTYTATTACQSVVSDQQNHLTNKDIMESTHDIAQDMEGMTLNPKARTVTPYIATTSSKTPARSVFRQQQPPSPSAAPFCFSANTTGSYTYTTTSTGISFSNPNASSSAPFCFAANPTGGYVYTTSPTGLSFSNPNAGSSTTTTATPTANQSQAEDLYTNHLLNCDDPIGLYKFSLYHSSLHNTHTHPVTANNRITKSRSSSSLRKHFLQQQVLATATPAPVCKPMEGIEKVPGTKTIHTSAKEEKEKEEHDRALFLILNHHSKVNLAKANARRAARKTAAKAEAARQAQKQSGLDAWRNEVWMPRVKVSRTYVNGEGDVVEESWEKTTPPKWSWEEASDDGVDAVEEKVWEEDDEMME